MSKVDESMLHGEVAPGFGEVASEFEKNFAQREEIATPLGLEFYIGLPLEVPDSRVATIEGFYPLRMLLHVNTMPVGMILGCMNPKSLTRRTFGNPKLRSPADFNRPEYRAGRVTRRQRHRPG